MIDAAAKLAKKKKDALPNRDLETGKNIVCAGQIKPATHNNEITLYCASDKGGGSRSYSSSAE